MSPRIDTNQLATDLIGLAALLARPDIGRILGTITTAASPDGLRSATTPRNGGPGGGGPSPLPTHTPATRTAQQLLTELHHLTTTVPTTTHLLRGWTPDRTTHTDPNCGHGLAPGQTTCTRLLEDGTRCGTTPVLFICRGCGREDVPAGQRRRGMCNACRLRASRGRPTVAAALHPGVWVG
jgi:hypothetical protein